MATPASSSTLTRLSWGGRLFFFPGQMLYVGPGAAADRHAHHLLQVAVSFDAPVEIDFGDGWIERRAGVIPSDVPHTFRTQASLLTLLFVDPEGPGGQSLRRRLTLGAAATADVETRLLTLPAPSSSSASPPRLTRCFIPLCERPSCSLTARSMTFHASMTSRPKLAFPVTD